MIEDQSPWNYEPEGPPGPGARGEQFGDDPRFVSGTLAGKRIRQVGVGNIGSRYASFTSELGGEVTAYDPTRTSRVFTAPGQVVNITSTDSSRTPRSSRR